MPRVLSLDEDGHLVQQPVVEAKTLRKAKIVDISSEFSDDEYVVDFMGSDTLEITAEIEARNTSGLRLLRSEDGRRSVDLLFSNERIQLADLSFPTRRWSWKTRLQIFIDKGLIEVFIDDGRRFVSKVVERNPEDNGVSFFTEKGKCTVYSLRMWQLGL